MSPQTVFHPFVLGYTMMSMHGFSRGFGALRHLFFCTAHTAAELPYAMAKVWPVEPADTACAARCTENLFNIFLELHKCLAGMGC